MLPKMTQYQRDWLDSWNEAVHQFVRNHGDAFGYENVHPSGMRKMGYYVEWTGDYYKEYLMLSPECVSVGM